MSFKIAGFATPTAYLKKYRLNHPHGFTLPFINGHDRDTILIPMIFDDRIDALSSYRRSADSLQLASSEEREGASHLILGQPALYTFVFHEKNRMRPYTAIKPVMIPHLRAWLKEGRYGETEDNAIRQAKVFCEDLIPPELNEQYADIERHAYRSSGRLVS